MAGDWPAICFADEPSPFNGNQDMAPPTTRLAPAHRIRIWIADSRPADYDGLKSAGDSMRLDVCFLSSANEVIRRWSAELPDVCLVNVRLPGMSGFDLVDMLRPFPAGTTLGMVGDCYLVEDEVRALSLGVHHYLCKPLETALLSGLFVPRSQKQNCFPIERGLVRIDVEELLDGLSSGSVNP
jgi:CheY-like chemotaxis protein